MKESSAFSTEQIEALTKDAGFLKNEAVALQHVIEEIPYDQSPPDGHSVTQILRLLDYAQLNYYHPVLEEGEKNTSPIHVEEHKSFEKTFEPDTEEETDVQQLLKKIAKHRQQIINTAKNITSWQTIVYMDDKEYTLYQFARKMIKFDQEQFKKIGQLVLSFTQEKESQRELDKLKSQRQQTAESTS